MIFKIAEAADMNELAALYSSLWGSPGSGWDEEYPTAEDISEDISNQDLIIAVRGGSIIGAIAVAGDRGDSHDDSNDSVLSLFYINPYPQSAYDWIRTSTP